MTLEEALRQVRSMLAEPEDAPTKFWTDEELKSWINEGYITFCYDTRILRGRAYSEVAPNTSEVTLPSSAIRVHAVWIVDESGNAIPLRRIKRGEAIQESTAELPTSYTVAMSNIIRLFPTPTRDVRLYIEYAYVPSAIASDEEFVIPERYLPAIIHYACHCALLKQKDLAPKASLHLATYQNYVVRALKENTYLTEDPTIGFIPYDYRGDFRF